MKAIVIVKEYAGLCASCAISWPSPGTDYLIVAVLFALALGIFRFGRRCGRDEERENRRSRSATIAQARSVGAPLP